MGKSVKPFINGFEKIVREAEPLAPHTWFQLGGPAEYFAEPHTFEELAALVRRCHDDEIPIRILGGGSNLLVRDDGVSGVVVRLSAAPFSGISLQGQIVTAGGGARLGHIISTVVREGLAGLEPLVGIPGTLGGALHGNAGSRGGDIGQWTCRATVMTRSSEILQREREDLVFSYRQSSLDELVILGCQFQLEKEDPQELTKRMQKLWIVKKASQPLGHQSAGCIFKNPRGISAGMLVDQAGLKGTRIGGAEVSDRHANFIVTDSDATSADVLRLIEVVRSRVAERLGVELETEIEIW
ncbi:MAG TPA: UDP-N-acetylmuramate dehydrogenase [Pirellulales bacterium]|nr:UDP-N-acetylmuramate dehydrogenase [Pirellulales bacterium]